MNQGSLISLSHLKLLEKEENSKVSSHYVLFLHLSNMSQVTGRLSETATMEEQSPPQQKLFWSQWILGLCADFHRQQIQLYTQFTFQNITWILEVLPRHNQMTWLKQTPVLQPQKDHDWEPLRNLHKIQPPTRQKEENTNFTVEGKRGKWQWMLLSVLLLCEIKKQNKNNPLKLGRCKVGEKKYFPQTMQN